MEHEKESPGYIPRKLLEGERVEVRQREVGLRGSWHPAKVVKVKYGRRVVEYEDLLTSDGTRKLCESVRLSKDLKHYSPTLRLKNGMSAEEPIERGFIRPLPPPRSTPLPIKWKSGLLVDAFYDGAWWEGILLDEPFCNHAESKVKVFFPEEGDELQILVSDLRVSQEWDEESGDWEVRGSWPFYSEIGEIDVSPLKQICHKRRSFLKKLWRQKRINGLQDNQMEELKNLHLLLAPFLQKQLSLHLGHGESAVQEKMTVCNENNSLVLKEATNQQDLQEPVARIVQPSHPPVSLQAGACCDKAKLDSNGEFCKLTAQQTEQDAFSNKIADMPNKYDPLVTSGAKGRVKDRLIGGSRAHSRVTRSASVPVQRIEELPLSRLHEMPNGCSQHTIDMLEEEKLQPSISDKWLPKIDLQPIILNPRKHIGTEVQQAEFFSSALLSSDFRACLNLQKNHFASVRDAALRDNGAVSADCSIPHKVRIRQARLAAKRYLLNAGWTFDVRNRTRGPAVKQEAVYVSPSGSRFFSLAAACRGLKSCEKHVNSVGEGRSKELELLRAYHMGEDFESLQKPNSRQAMAELLDGLPKGEGNTPLLMTDGKLSGLPSSLVSIIEEKKKKAEKQKKRKSEVLDVSSPAELKRKRGRPPLKKGGTSLWQESKGSRGRGGCRMQVLLSFPEKEKDLDFPKDTGDLSQFKKSTVLSWLMDKGILKENEPVSYINRKDGHVMKKGHVTREGVICDCCKDVFTLSNFEAHAGSKLHRPSANTFLDDGRSISDCQLEACALQDAKENQSLMDISDDTCCVCGDGGELILCDHCPLTFHADCIGLEIIPEGDWYCPRCSCGICGSHQLADQDLDNTMHHCVQCELEYHVACAQGHTILTPVEAAMSFWFCNRQCREIFTALRGLVGISHPMEGGFAWTLLRSMKKDQGLLPSSLEDMAEHHSKLSVAHGVMQECFVPMIDPRTNINLLSQALYNRRSKVARLNYAGFYTILLEKGDEVISVATIRVHGARLAEMPLVGTRFQYRRQGMCRRLMHALEEMLKSIGVEKLILPAVPELLETWIGAFNFQKINLQETRELSKLSLMTFPGTTLLQKHLPAGSTTATKFMCLPHISDKADNIESPMCKSVEDFFMMARASLDCGLLERGKAFLTVGSINHLGASSNMSNHRSELVQPYSPVDPQTPVTMEASNGYLNILSNAGKSKNRFKSKDQLESSGDASVMNKVETDDDIYTRVVIATTRSNRLVKSRRWVADGLKELKNAKQSKRTFATPATSSESAVDLECSGLFETLAHFSNGHGGYDAENFYVRTRRKTPLISVESAINNEAQIDPASECTNNVAVDSLHQNYRTQYDFTMEVTDQKSSSSQKMNTSWDESFKFGTCHRNGLGVDLINELREELSTCPNFYSRRKKRGSLHPNLATEIVSKETTAQITELLSQEQTSCTPVEGTLEGFRTNFTVPIRPCLITEGVHGQG